MLDEVDGSGVDHQQHDVPSKSESGDDYIRVGNLIKATPAAGGGGGRLEAGSATTAGAPLPPSITSPVISDISTILVDPPRAGLDPVTLALCAKFARILYISCNPDTLEPALQQLLSTHRLERMALFDHFPYTRHVECGVFLVANDE